MKIHLLERLFEEESKGDTKKVVFVRSWLKRMTLSYVKSFIGRF